VIINYSHEPWTHVFDNVYIGGTFVLDAHGFPQFNDPDRGFDYVVSLAGCAVRRPPNAIHVARPIPDAPLTKTEQVDMVRLARLPIFDGEKFTDTGRVLVRCRAGKNRSAFVALLAMFMRYPNLERNRKIRDLREKRGTGTLSNEWFVNYLRNFGKDPVGVLDVRQ
jgi:hypothetical protein